MKDIFTTICIQFKSRWTPKTKFRFMSWVISHCKHLGYQVTVMNEKNLFNRTVNVVIGNPEQARNIILVGYDTPAASPFANLYYPLNHGKNRKVQLHTYIFHLFLSILFLILGLGLVLMLKDLDGGMYYGSLILAVASFVTSYFVGKGSANKSNYNRNNAAVAVTLDLIREKPEQAAYIFVDNTCQSFNGYKVIRQHIPDLSGKQIICLDCIGKGEHVYLVAASGEAYQNIHSNIVMLQEKQPWTLSDKSCMFFSGTMLEDDYVVKNTGKHDSEIDFRQMESIKEKILRIIR